MQFLAMHTANRCCTVLKSPTTVSVNVLQQTREQLAGQSGSYLMQNESLTDC
jgi:hypothetical protein